MLDEVGVLRLATAILGILAVCHWDIVRPLHILPILLFPVVILKMFLLFATKQEIYTVQLEHQFLDFNTHYTFRLNYKK